MLRNAPKDIQLLRLLNTFEYLTATQLVRLGFAKKKNTVYQNLRRMAQQRPLFHLHPHKEYASNKRPTSVDGFIMMTPSGAAKLQEFEGMDASELNYKKSKPPELYLHRRNQVDFHITTVQFCEQQNVELVFFHTDYHYEGSNRNSPPDKRLKKRTQVLLGDMPFIPDGIFLVRANEQQQYFFALEVYNGYSTDRVLRQLNKHVAAIEHGVIADSYGLNLAWRVAVVFDSQEAMDNVIKRAIKNVGITSLEKFFVFNTIERIQQQYATDWYNVYGEPTASLFVKK